MTIREALARLCAVRELTFEAHSAAPVKTGWTGAGRGTVRVEQPDGDTVLLHETGFWSPEGGREIAFRNVFRWTAAPEDGRIRLEHLRFGPDNPLYLFALAFVDEQTLESAEPHTCREDCYTARMTFERETITLRWTVAGPEKAESIVYTYR